ncbi:hypothetical protein [Actinacidiphila rubida]|uniref:Uncharacterized protein n=1 Tax=Actinacidiphila rubida TaxID=310780 RepID=A0A1H8UCF5_9ACTN|nr:hypothetical protein [Actinacidiphila rubida]SEO63174.1 hypothetical protein SAMN05216267_103375 [Actinacidiphila rubida]SEP00544.1 hypothetical protein SAMN05216267_106825 [Actinacidiphila rubida]
MNTTHHADDLENRLPGLLADAAADPPGNPRRLAQVQLRASRRRRTHRAGAASALAVVAVAAAMTPALLDQGAHPAGAPSQAGRTGRATATPTPAATPKTTSPATADGHYPALFSVPNTTLSTSLAIAYGTGPGTKQVTIPDGSRIGAVELRCVGKGAIGVDDHGTLGSDLSVPPRPSTPNCAAGLSAEADLVAEGVRSGPNTVVAPGTPVTMTVRTTGNVRWWLVVGRVGGQSRSGVPDPDTLTLGPAPAEQHLAGRTTAAGLLYQCGQRKEQVRIAFAVSGTPVHAVLHCDAGTTYVITFSAPLHLTAPVKDPLIRLVGSPSSPDDYWAALLTPSGLAAWSAIPGVIHAHLPL